MKSIPKILAVSSIFCLAFAATPAEACERRGQHRAGKGHGMIKRILRTAQLTPDQKRQLKAMRQEFKEGRKILDKGQFRAKRRAMREQMAAAIESGDDGELEELFARKDQMHAHHQRMKMKKLKMVLSILTDEQRARVAQNMRQQQGKRQRRRGGNFD